MNRQLFLKCALLVFLTISGLSSCKKRLSRESLDARLDNRAQLIVDKEQNISNAVRELMKLTDIDQTTSLHDAVNITQRYWLRSPGNESHHLPEKYPQIFPILMKYFVELGLVERVVPTKNDYDYVLLLGASYEVYLERLRFLEQLIESGIKIKKLALLGSHRLLEKPWEMQPLLEQYVFEQIPLTEIEMMEVLFEKSELKKKLPNIQVIRVASPLQVLADNTITRANTRDTIIDFARLNLKAGAALVISSQPHLLRQHLIATSILTNDWVVETVGPQSPSWLSSSAFLDELGRTMFELRKIFATGIKNH